MLSRLIVYFAMYLLVCALIGLALAGLMRFLTWLFYRPVTPSAPTPASVEDEDEQAPPPQDDEEVRRHAEDHRHCEDTLAEENRLGEQTLAEEEHLREQERRQAEEQSLDHTYR